MQKAINTKKKDNEKTQRFANLVYDLDYIVIQPAIYISLTSQTKTDNVFLVSIV